MELPQEFLERMKNMLGDEYESFLKTYEQPRNFGLRVNTMKISVEEFVKLVPFHLKKIPWTDNGFYYEKEDDPARHPFYYAGLYYLQEPSAMTPASVLPVEPGDHVLDLCAAPGGKATALAAKLCGKGLLVANDISASRAKALLKNLEVFGVKNSFVTNAVPNKLAAQFPEAFDKILVDAPCSGEGMFRKDMANARAWSTEKVEACAKTQREIIKQAVSMLRPGGMLLYSTCTFAPEENEQIIAYVRSECPEMKLCEIPWKEGFSHGRPEWGFPDSAVQADRGEELSRCVRIFPHKMNGEGHFLALLQKAGTLSRIHAPVQRKGGSPSREEEKVLREFLQDVSMEWQMNQIEVRKEQVYLIPEPPAIRGGIPFLRNGLYLGELKRGRFEPSQSFAMALRKEEYSSVLDFDQKDERIRQYLRGETVMADDMATARPKGWQLVCVSGYPLGWGKLVNGTLKNKYHPGWRMIG